MLVLRASVPIHSLSAAISTESRDSAPAPAAADGTDGSLVDIAPEGSREKYGNTTSPGDEHLNTDTINTRIRKFKLRRK